MAGVPVTADAPVMAAGTGMVAAEATMAVVQVIAHHPHLQVQDLAGEAGMATPAAAPAPALADRAAVATSIATAGLVGVDTTARAVAAGRSSHEP